MEIRPSGTCVMTIGVSCKDVRVGNKLCALHDMKFTVGVVDDDENMPCLKEDTTGLRFRPDLYIGIKSLNHGIGGQFLDPKYHAMVIDRGSQFIKDRDAGRAMLKICLTEGQHKSLLPAWIFLL